MHTTKEPIMSTVRMLARGGTGEKLNYCAVRTLVKVSDTVVKLSGLCGKISVGQQAALVRALCDAGCRLTSYRVLRGRTAGCGEGTASRGTCSNRRGEPAQMVRVAQCR